MTVVCAQHLHYPRYQRQLSFSLCAGPSLNARESGGSGGRRVRYECVSPKGAEVIVNTTRITVNPEKRKELLQTIGRLVEPIAGVNGCRTFRFYVDATDENSSLLLSEWESESDLNSYLRSNNFAVLRGAITVLSIRTSESRAFVTSGSEPLET